MIYFYNKILLLLIPLSFLPIVFHLLYFRYSKRFKFTYIDIIHQVLKQYQPKKKLVDLIVLVLRCLIVFLIIIFLAHPVIYTNPNEINSNKIIFLFDNSLSMQQKILNDTKLKICKNTFFNVLSEIQKYNSKVKIYIFNENIKPLQENFSSVSSSILDEVKNIKHTYMGTNLNGCLNYVLSTDSQQQASTTLKILVFTDFAEHIMDEDLEFVNKFNNNVEIAFCYPEVVEKNRYVESLNVVDNNDFVEIEYQPVSNEKNDPSEVELVINDKLIDKKVVSNYIKKSKFTYIYDTGLDSKFYGYIKLSLDSLLADNIFYFTHQKENKNKKILCLINEPSYVKGFSSKKYYFEKLKVGWRDIYIKSVEDFNEVNFKDYDVVICVGLDSLNNINMDGEKNIFIIFPAEEIDLENYDLTFPGLEFVEKQEVNLKDYRLNLGDVDEFNRFLERFEYKNIYVKKRYLITIKDLASYKVMLKYDDNAAALVNKDNIYIFTFPIDRVYTNFAYKPLFISLFGYILKTNETDFNQNFKNYYIVSEKVFINNVKEILPIYNLGLNEKFYKIENNSIKFFVPNIYEIITSNGVKDKIAVNVSPKESKVELISKSKVKKIFSKAKIYPKFFDIKKVKIEDILNWIFGKDISSNIVYIVVILFIIETILSRLSKRII